MWLQNEAKCLFVFGFLFHQHLESVQFALVLRGGTELAFDLNLSVRLNDSSGYWCTTTLLSCAERLLKVASGSVSSPLQSFSFNLNSQDAATRLCVLFLPDPKANKSNKTTLRAV